MQNEWLARLASIGHRANSDLRKLADISVLTSVPGDTRLSPGFKCHAEGTRCAEPVFVGLDFQLDLICSRDDHAD
jgi:hypothetical protein